jgi:hypothetical protein
MSLENPQKKSGKEKPALKVLRGGKFDETSFIKRAEKILPRVQNTNDVTWLYSVFNQYSEFPKDESLKEEKTEGAENIAAAAAQRLSELGHSVEDQKDEYLRKKTEDYNV